MRISDWSSDVCSSDLLFYLRIDIVHNSSLSNSSDHDGYLIDQPSPLFRYREIFTSAIMARSEEHTSELQSLMRISYAVFCLKKKNNKNQILNPFQYTTSTTTTTT